MAGAAGTFVMRTLSAHAQTAIWVIERYLPVRFVANEEDGLVRVSVAGRVGTA